MTRLDLVRSGLVTAGVAGSVWLDLTAAQLLRLWTTTAGEEAKLKDGGPHPHPSIIHSSRG